MVGAKRTKPRTTLPLGHADLEATAASTDIWGHLAFQIGVSDDAPAALLAAPPHPVYGAVWNKKVINSLTADRINAVLIRIRKSPFQLGNVGAYSLS